ncbi:MAG: diaminopimelate decarboxylase [candidate division Zixibacteria bacterium]|nr:diaminopimelate decarboxylase [candidate division Zixibacteria bacterium]
MLSSKTDIKNVAQERDMLSRVSPEEASHSLRGALERKLIKDEDSAAVFYDLSRMESRINELTGLFPDDTLHAVAAKANPLTSVLKSLNLLGAGLETASLPELYLAEEAGFAPGSIVFDSPVKTIEEIKHALNAGVHINIDSWGEFERVQKLISDGASHGNIGLRVNPQVGIGDIEITSVGGTYSKFGIPIEEYYEVIVRKYLENEWLNGIHVHTGSQGCGIDLLARGIKVVYELAKDVNRRFTEMGKEPGIRIFDIGGGLPVSYSGSQKTASMEEYRDLLRRQCPELFTSDFKLITEFGRHIHANNGWALSRVEYIKESGGRKTLAVHLGADMFIRKCYQPEIWHHDITVTDARGNLKLLSPTTYAVSGPLCFAGDMIEQEITLPEVKQGDYLIFHDVGAYTLSMWSRYNSRQIPKIIGYYSSSDEMSIIKDREAPSRVWEFWS